MSVFISWSGPRSQAYARILAGWLPLVVTDIPIFFSENIEAGKRAHKEIEAGLKEARFGVCCMTPQNLTSPWLNYEAGALANALALSTTLPELPVVPLLFDGLTDLQLEAPLKQFQAGPPDKVYMKKVVHGVNSSLGEDKLAQVTLDNYFERFWDDFKNAVDELAGTPAATPIKRDPDDMIAEILETVRELQRRAPTYSVVYWQALERHQDEMRVRRLVKERTEASNISVKEVGDAHCPDLIIDHDILVWIEASTPSLGFSGIVNAGEHNLTRYEKRHGLINMKHLIVGVGQVPALDSRNLSGKAYTTNYIHVTPSNVFLGNRGAQELTPWLVDELFYDRKKHS